METELDAGYGIYGGGAKVKWATLLFDADAASPGYDPRLRDT